LALGAAPGHRWSRRTSDAVGWSTPRSIRCMILTRQVSAPAARCLETNRSARLLPGKQLANRGKKFHFRAPPFGGPFRVESSPQPKARGLRRMATPAMLAAAHSSAALLHAASLAVQTKGLNLAESTLEHAHAVRLHRSPTPEPFVADSAGGRGIRVWGFSCQVVVFGLKPVVLS
jgi:hypothetical protein